LDTFTPAYLAAPDVVVNPAGWSAPDLDIDSEAGPTHDLAAFEFHRRLVGYRETPLIDAPDLAARAGVARVLVKQEGGRLGLPSFKMLGASWAIARALSAEGAVPDLATLRATAPRRTLLTATDGNHGHAVARMARMLGLAAHIVVAAPTKKSRIAAIRRENALVTLWNGSYDEAVEHTAALAEQDPSLLLVSDTSWPGYERFPGWVIDGYSTMFHELDGQLAELGVEADLVAVPVGVGALATAVVRHWRATSSATVGVVRDHDFRSTPHIVGVEPAAAGCLYASLLAGREVSVPGPHESVMSGLDCGRLSHIAWPELRRGISAAVRVDDERALDAVRALREAGVEAGESGAASLAGVLALCETLDSDARAGIGLGPDSTVVLLNTEGTATTDFPAPRLAGIGGFHVGDVYVHYTRLTEPRGRYPLVMWHGGGLTGACFEDTPDGRQGWQWNFLSAGHDVLICDAGRASWRSPEARPVVLDKKAIWELFRIGSRFPVAAFEESAKQVVPTFAGSGELRQQGYEATLRRIGPCVLLTHSAAGPRGVKAALATGMVRAHIAVEPSGVPEVDPASVRHIPHLFIWGDHLHGDWVDLYRSARRFHEALIDLGGSSDWIDLPERGIHGNSHMIMMDDNSAEVAALICQWLTEHDLTI
jgi:diaminopropionate ammonia-lyase